MSWPEIVKTRTVVIPEATILEDGTDLRIRAKITASRSLVNVETGYRMESSFTRNASGLGEAISFILPVTDMSGWMDATTGHEILIENEGEFTHTYTACIQLVTQAGVLVGRPINLGPFIVPTWTGSGDEDINLYTALSMGTREGDQVLVPSYWEGFIDERIRLAMEEYKQELQDINDRIDSLPSDLTQFSDWLQRLEDNRPYVSLGEYGASLDGTSDDSAALMSAYADSPEGAVITAPPGSLISLSGVVLEGKKDITLDLSSSKVIQRANQTPIVIRGGFRNIQSVNPITPSTVEVEDGSVFTLGDVVKITSEDNIPGARPPSPTSGGGAGRLGSYYVVRSVSGNVVTIHPSIKDDYITNPRIGIHDGSSAQVFIGEQYCLPEDQYNFTTSQLTLDSIIDARVETRVTRGGGTGLGFRNCFRGKGRVFVSNLLDVPGGSGQSPLHFGYGLSSAGSSSMDYEVHASNVRHGYTTGPISSDTDPIDNAWDENNRVTGVVHMSINSAFDTHHGSRNTTFDGVRVQNSATAVSLRGENHRVVSPVITQTSTGIRAFYETAYPVASTRGHVVSDAMITGATDAVSVVESSSAEVAGSKEYPTLTIMGGVFGYSDQAISGQNAHIRTYGKPVFVHESAVIGSSGVPVDIYSGDWYGDCVFDMTQVTDGAGFYSLINFGSSAFDADLDLEIISSGALYSSMEGVFNGPNSTIHSDILLRTDALSTNSLRVVRNYGDSRLRGGTYRTTNANGKSSAYVSTTPTASARILLGGSHSPHLTIRLNNTSGAQIDTSGLEDGVFSGQLVTLHVPNNSAWPVMVPGLVGRSTSIKTSEYVTVVWDGVSSVWRVVG